MDTPSVQYVTTSDGYSIACCVTGEGRDLVLMPEPFNHLHLMWASALYRSLFEPLSRRFRMVQFDARGQGLSQRGLPADVEQRSILIDIEAVADSLDLKRFVLYGPYYLGTVAADYAARHPERVEALVLWNMDLGRPKPQDPIIHDLPQLSWDLFLDTYARTFNSYEEYDVALRRLRAAADPGFIVREYPEAEVEAILGQISVPTLVVARRIAAMPHSEEAGRWVASRIAGSRLVLFDDVSGGRYTDGSKEPPLVSAIDQFLAGLPETKQAEAGGVSDVISGREVEVLRLLAAGRSNQEIADELVISLNTVRRHVSNIFDKTGAINRAQATAYAKDHGIA
jgi:DNA-binding CsgD family transcriptional regulator/pimeloyl-ACP methyl ester carboxylesterase